MKTLTVSAPDEIFDQTIEALCFTGGYNGDPTDADAKLAFAKEQVITLLGDANRQYAAQQIRKVAMAQAELAINSAFEQIMATHDSVVIDVVSVIDTPEA